MNNYFDLGTYRWPITTDSADAQLWFDRGLIWCYGYNHEEAVCCFEKALEHDPKCAMAYWGIAYATGPNYNRPWKVFTTEELQEVVATCHTNVAEAQARLDGATPVEEALIRAQEKRYQSDQVVDEETFCVWNDDYAAAMRDVYQTFPDNLDVSALYVEAMINRTPWALWDLPTGQPAEGADTVQSIAVLERSIQQVEDEGREPHPGLLHLYIHVMEMSPHPERALRTGDILRDLVPDAGHLLHMPSHVDILCGHYYNAVAANTRASVANDKYLAYAGPFNFYTGYRCHDLHFKIYAAMFLGQYNVALEAAEALIEIVPEELLRLEKPPMADFVECMVSMKMHVLVRFGKWQKIIDEPLPDDQTLYCNTTAMLHYAKAVAYAASGNVEAAEREKPLFEAARAKVPESRYVFNNTCVDVLGIAAEMLYGELEYRKGNYAQAFAHLRKSVYLDDHLAYAEPWGWLQPTRHALGALLLEQGHVAEAEAVYRADLGLDDTLYRPAQHPDNVWSLHGYVECLHRQGKDAEAVAMQARLDVVMARADVPIHASCYCRLEHDHCG